MSDSIDGVLPRGVALAWGIAERPQRGPKRELSIERIVDAAIEIADTEGLAGLSMSKVATSLGFTTMSLYRYVTSKDELLLLMQDIAGDIAIPVDEAPGGWRTGLTRIVLALREVYLAHPWLGDIPVQGAPLGPSNLRIVDWTLRELHVTPLTEGEKMSVLLLLTSYTRVSTVLSNQLAASLEQGTAPRQSGAEFAETLAMLVTPERFPYLAPLVAAGIYTAEPEEGEEFEDFDFGLARILDGIELHIERAGSPGGAAPASPIVTEETQPLPRDSAVREASRVRREAEARLREAQRREREAIKFARQRAGYAAAKSAKG